jgi:RNA polymerase sigma-70 factor (ECF subfamily)
VEELIRRHWPKAHRAALLIVQDLPSAEDVAQEAMLSVVRSLDRFDWRRPIGPWLHRIVVNRSLDHLRAERRHAELHLSKDPPDDAGPAVIGRDALSNELVTALSLLDPTDRAIVVLRHLLDYRSPEISRLLEIPAATVRTRLRRALGQLHERLVTSEVIVPAESPRGRKQ